MPIKIFPKFWSCLFSTLSAKVVTEVATLDEAITSTTLTIGGSLRITDRADGIFDIVLLSTVTPNGFDIIASTGSPTLAFVLRAPYTMLKMGSLGDGSDDTARAIRLNSLTKKLVFDPNTTFFLQNFVPLSGSTLVAAGAEIDKHGSVTYLTTGSSGAVILANDDVKIQGGTWGDSVAQTDFSGSIILDSGVNCSIIGAKFIETWGGVSGHASQNGSNEMTDLIIESCIFDGCFHNSYLADVNGLTYTKNFSKNANRDGLKTFRNVRNTIITDNHFYDNGDATPGQSQDGIDTFIAGDFCIITGNYIHGNASKGIDIKRAPAGDAETVVSGNYIIANNFIHDNSDIGVEVDSASVTQANIPFINIHDNHVYSNAQRGMFLRRIVGLKVVNNDVYLNGTDGIRVDDVSGQVLIVGNNIHENGQSSSSTGLLIQPTVANAIVHSNRVFKGTSGSQDNGILSSATPGQVYNNDISGHVTDVSTTIIDGTCLGNSQSTSLLSGTPDIAIIADRAGQLAAIQISINATESVNVEISKRNATTGVFEGIIHNASVSFTAFVSKTIPISISASDRVLSKNQVIYINVTAGVWTSATATTSVIS